MSFYFTPGNALGCNVNAHRSAWNGVICTQPETWNCSAAQDFREKFCGNGDGRCYHLHLFDPASPSLSVDDNGAGWILGDHIHALDDQVLLLWGQEFSEPRGVRESGYVSYHLFGAYRVKSAIKTFQNHRTIWRIEPYVDGWSRFHQFQVIQPRFQPAGGAYIKQIERAVLLRLFEELAARANDPKPGWVDPSDAERFWRFHDNVGAWLDTAKATAERAGITSPDVPSPARTVIATGPLARSPFEVLRHIPLSDKGERRPATRSLPTAVIEPPPVKPKTSRAPLVEPARTDWIAATYGAETLLGLMVASLTKPLIILKGYPGVGKSHLAVRLLDDPRRERTLVVPVSATWRGREDLLGYINPVTNHFEPTKFTEFLFAATEAWKAGDTRTRVVVFEEFNLAQPEYWLSEILVVSQYSDEADRVIQLGGAAVRGRKGPETSVALAPSIRFVATINNDHTTRSLSARVIDRAAIVELGIDPRSALARVGLELSEEQILAIADLEFALRAKGASFSMRSAASLKICQEAQAELKLDLWDAIDLVLVQEVLMKVRLLARDPVDEAILQGLEKWVDSEGRHLGRCAALISAWRESMKSGFDVLPV